MGDILRRPAADLMSMTCRHCQAVHAAWVVAGAGGQCPVCMTDAMVRTDAKLDWDPPLTCPQCGAQGKVRVECMVFINTCLDGFDSFDDEPDYGDESVTICDACEYKGIYQDFRPCETPVVVRRPWSRRIDIQVQVVLDEGPDGPVVANWTGPVDVTAYGDTEEEALANIRIAIEKLLESVADERNTP